MKICISCGDRFDSLDWRCPLCGFAPSAVEGFRILSPDRAGKKSGFDSDLFQRLFKLEDGCFWFRSRNALICWALKRFLAQAKTFLEIGCGTGYVLFNLNRAFPDISLCGSDVSVDALAHASRRVERANLFQMDVCRMPFEGEFDAIGAFDVIEHIDDDELAFSQIYRSLRPGGALMMTVPQHPFLWGRFDDLSLHVRRYRANDLRSKIRKAGFDLIFMTSFVSLLLPALVASRMLMRCFPKTDVMKELKMRSPLNEGFEAIMALELAMIKVGMTFPVGASLIMVARKAM